MAVILDHVKDEDGDGAVNIEDVKLFLKRNKAGRTAFKADEKYEGGDFRSDECVDLALAILGRACVSGYTEGVTFCTASCRNEVFGASQRESR